MGTNSINIEIIEIPFDLGASRPGAAAGPMALRVAGLEKALTGMGHHVHTTAVPVPVARFPGEVNMKFRGDAIEICRRAAAAGGDAVKNGYVPLFLGGDHTIAMGTVAGVSVQRKIGLVWFDAHADLNTPATTSTGHLHGMPLAHLLGMGDEELAGIAGPGPAVEPDRVVLVGVRDIEAREREAIRNLGIKTFTMSDIDHMGMSRVAWEALQVVNQDTEGFHVSFDLDGCDPNVIPGTGTAITGGASLRESHLLLEKCAATGRMVSMDLVELNPFMDHANVSAVRSVEFIQSAFGRSIL